jgi:hypothetical protein
MAAGHGQRSGIRRVGNFALVVDDMEYAFGGGQTLLQAYIEVGDA